MTAVLHDINTERERQLLKGFDAQHDDKHGDEQLLYNARCLLSEEPDDWGLFYKHKQDRRRQLVIAATLIVAEIERMDRLQEKMEGG